MKRIFAALMTAALFAFYCLAHANSPGSEVVIKDEVGKRHVYLDTSDFPWVVVVEKQYYDKVITTRGGVAFEQNLPLRKTSAEWSPFLTTLFFGAIAFVCSIVIGTLATMLRISQLAKRTREKTEDE